MKHLGKFTNSNRTPDNPESYGTPLSNDFLTSKQSDYTGTVKDNDSSRGDSIFMVESKSEMEDFKTLKNPLNSKALYDKRYGTPRKKNTGIPGKRAHGSMMNTNLGFNLPEEPDKTPIRHLGTCNIVCEGSHDTPHTLHVIPQYQYPHEMGIPNRLSNQQNKFMHQASIANIQDDRDFPGRNS